MSRVTTASCGRGLLPEGIWAAASKPDAVPVEIRVVARLQGPGLPGDVASPRFVTGKARVP